MNIWLVGIKNRKCEDVLGNLDSHFFTTLIYYKPTTNNITVIDKRTGRLIDNKNNCELQQPHINIF